MLKPTIDMVKIKALIFDIGGVLFTAKENGKEKHLLSSFEEACILLKEEGIDVGDKYEKIFEIYLNSSRGDISKEETADLMSKELGVSPEIIEEGFEKVYSKNVAENLKLYNYILDLKSKGYKIGILSTQFHLSNKVLVPDKYKEIFDAMEISCEDGLRKPDEKAYSLILNRLGINAEEAIFVDDKKENVDAANKLGLLGIIFKNNKQFFSDLNKVI